jgi:hypothetical protein
VVERADPGEIRTLLRSRFAMSLAPTGWSPAVEASDSPVDLAEFVRPIGGGVVATVEIGCVGREPDGLPVEISQVWVGVGYEPLQRLWPLLGEVYRLSLVWEPIWPPEDDTRLPPDDEEEPRLAVSSAADAEAAVAQLTAVVLAQAPAVIEQHGTVEQLLDELRSDQEDGSVDERTVALLAAAGRLEEARAELARYRPLTGSAEGDRDARRFVHQITRYLDSNGDPALIPSHPPPSRYQSSPRKPMAELWREGRAQDEAVKAVKRLGAATGRAERRAALERELAARGLTQDPLWFERTLDQLAASPVEQAQQTFKALAELGRVGLGAIKAIRDRKLPDHTTPGWLEPPDRAAYEIPSSGANPWAAVQLNADAGDWLDRVHAARPQFFGTALNLEAWLDWKDHEQPDQHLAVHIGPQPVGILDDHGTEAFTAVMQAAAERDELPSTMARLTQRPNGYLLEVQLPDA